MEWGSLPPPYPCVLLYTLSKDIISEVYSPTGIQEAFALSNNYTSGSGTGTSDNNRELISRREVRVSSNAGQMPTVGPVRSYPGPFDFESVILSLRELFALDRQIASQPDSTRCGICYLYFPVNELHYREEEGFYVCRGCERALGKQVMSMLRRQQK